MFSKLKSNKLKHINVELEMDELDLTAAESKATYEEIKDYVLKQSGLKVSNLYIAQVKQKYGIIERDEIKPFEIGGRADKRGNKYEINCIIYEMLKVLDETNYSVIIEALGTDEIGTDILEMTFDGLKEHQQCKARNGRKNYMFV